MVGDTGVLTFKEESLLLLGQFCEIVTSVLVVIGMLYLMAAAVCAGEPVTRNS